MGNPYDLLVKQDAHVTEWSNISTHPDIASMSAAIDAKNTVTVNASGSVSAGSLVAFNDDGTISMVYKDADSVGSSSNITGNSVYWESIYYQPDDKMLLVSDTGTFVGTVSGDTISWGPITANYANNLFGTVIYDTRSGKLLYALKDKSAPYEWRLNTAEVSGDSIINWGTRVWTDLWNYPDNKSYFGYDPVHEVFIWNGSDSGLSYFQVGRVEGSTIISTSTNPGSTYFAGVMSYNPVQGKIIHFKHRDAQIHVGTIASSGAQTISWGADINHPDIGSYSLGTDHLCWGNVYDSGNDRMVFAFIETSHEIHMFAGEYVDDDTMTFGPIASTGYLISKDSRIDLAYDESSGNVVLCFPDNDNTGYGTFIVGTVNPNDNSISLSSGAVFVSASTLVDLVCEYHPTEQKVMVGYDNYTRFIDIGSSNLLQDNFLGIAQNDALHGQPVTIGTLGFMDEQQTGLTVPERYFSDAEGNLQNFGQVEIGKSSSTTDLIITE